MSDRQIVAALDATRAQTVRDLAEAFNLTSAARPDDGLALLDAMVRVAGRIAPGTKEGDAG